MKETKRGACRRALPAAAASRHRAGPGGADRSGTPDGGGPGARHHRQPVERHSVAVSWAVTANLLAAAASTPLIGRLADLHNKKHILLGVLAVVLIGSVL